MFETELAVGRAYVDQLLLRYVDGGLDDQTAALAKLWTTEMLGRVVDTCLQLHGGWGYMLEYPIARAFADARVERIAGGLIRGSARRSSVGPLWGAGNERRLRRRCCAHSTRARTRGWRLVHAVADRTGCGRVAANSRADGARSDAG